jgi:hypothetical protein
LLTSQNQIPVNFKTVAATFSSKWEYIFIELQHVRQGKLAKAATTPGAFKLVFIDFRLKKSDPLFEQGRRRSC